MRRVAEVIVVEGRYDKNTLSQVVDASIVTLEGFAAFHDREKLAFLRRLAEKRGLIVLTEATARGSYCGTFSRARCRPGGSSTPTSRISPARSAANTPPAKNTN